MSTTGSGFVILLLFKSLLSPLNQTLFRSFQLLAKLLFAKPESLPEAGKRLYVRFQQEMDMRRHEGESIEQKTESFFILSEEF